MFRRLTQIICLSLAVVFFGGCLAHSPVAGILVTAVDGPVNATTFDQTARSGSSCAFSLLGLIAWGNASIDEAKREGQIKQVASVDFSSFSLLGTFGSFCTVVRGN